jgi:hypothetical protein
VEEERIETNGTDLRDAVSSLAGEIGTLVRQEVDLARCELAEKVERAKGGAARIGAGGAFSLVAVFTLAAAAVLGLTLLLVQWLPPIAAAAVSATIVGVILAVVGYVLMKNGGERLSPEQLLPKRTLESIKEDARWARRQI